MPKAPRLTKDVSRENLSSQNRSRRRAEEPRRRDDVVVAVRKVPAHNLGVLRAADDAPRVELQLEHARVLRRADGVHDGLRAGGGGGGSSLLESLSATDSMVVNGGSPGGEEEPFHTCAALWAVAAAAAAACCCGSWCCCCWNNECDGARACAGRPWAGGRAVEGVAFGVAGGGGVG